MAHSQTTSLLIEIKTLKKELNASKKTVDQYASSIAKLFVELENLRSSICQACKQKLVPGISASAVAVTAPPSTNSGSPGLSSSTSISPFQGRKSQHRPRSPVITSARNSSDRLVVPRPMVNNTSFRVPPRPAAVPTSTSTIGGSHKRTTNILEPKSEWPVVYNPEVKKALELHVTHVFAYESLVRCLNMSPDGQKVAIGLYKEGKTYINEVRTGSNICVLVDRYIKDPLDIIRVQFSPDGQLVATVASDYRIRVWDITQRRMRAMFRSCAYGIAFSPDGHYLVSESIDSVLIWNMRDGSSRKLTDTDWFPNVAFSPDGRYIAACNNDDSLRIWDARTAKLIARWQGHADRIWCLKFTPDGKGLMSGSVDNTIKYWDASPLGNRQAQSGRGQLVPGQRLREIRTLEGHKDPVRSIAFFRNTRWVLTCSNDGTMRVWDIETGIWQLRLNYFAEMDVSRTETFLAAVDGYRRASLWEYKELQV